MSQAKPLDRMLAIDDQRFGGQWQSAAFSSSMRVNPIGESYPAALTYLGRGIIPINTSRRFPSSQSAYNRVASALPSILEMQQTASRVKPLTTAKTAGKRGGQNSLVRFKIQKPVYAGSHC